MKFLRNFLAAISALVVFSLLGFFFLMAIIAAMEDTEKYTVKDNSILKISFSQPLADRDFDDPFSNMSFAGDNMNRIGVINLRKALDHAATDDKIKGVVLYAPSLMGGFALGQEARKALYDFKSSGKFIWAYSDVLTEGGYYLSSVADKVFLSPEGIIEWNGISAEINFFKGTFDKLDIKPQIFRVGEYKSAVEPFIKEKMSDENREQIKSMISSIYGSMIREIAETRDLTEDQLRELSDNMTVQLPQDAVDHDLITGLIYKDEFEALLAEEIGVEEADDINWASYSQYNTSFSGYKKSKNKIAVIIAEGEIIMGSKQQGIITPSQFVKELKKAREDDNVKAVVFRVNSPGGDPLASDLIWREVVNTSKVKPIIASMSNYAASGGYYISMAADSIVAEPTTITGSIGIYGIIFNIGDFMANKLGITTDRESTGNYSNIFTTTRALTAAEKTIIQNMVNKGYESFTTKAAEGRNMQLDDLLKVASGRVWTGEQAKEIGLVDEIGGLEDAINIAAAKADLGDDYKLRYYPVQKTALEEVLEKFSGTANAKIMQMKLGEFYPYMDLLEKVENMHGVQARIPFEIEIQ